MAEIGAFASLDHLSAWSASRTEGVGGSRALGETPYTLSPGLTAQDLIGESAAICAEMGDSAAASARKCDWEVASEAFAIRTAMYPKSNQNAQTRTTSSIEPGLDMPGTRQLWEP